MSKVGVEDDESPNKMNCQLGICNDQLVMAAEANEIVLSDTGCDNELVDTTINNNHANDGQEASELSLGFKDILHVAVDSERRLLQILAAPAPRDLNDTGRVVVGGTVVFKNDRDLFKFQHTLQSVSDLDIFNFNSRQNSRFL